MKNKSTYSLLVNADAEEKGRSIFETAAYALVLLCMALSGWNFASGTVTLPGKAGSPNQPQSVILNAPVEQPPAEQSPVIASR
jgi:hypothetical protein